MPGSRSMEMRNAWKAAEKLDQPKTAPQGATENGRFSGTAEVVP